MRSRLLLLVWLVVVASTWWTRAPALPTSSIPMQESVHHAVLLRNGELAVVPYSNGWKDLDAGPCRGPIEIWSLANREKIREVFSKHDEILTPYVAEHGKIILLRAGQLYAGDIFTGALIGPLPGGARRPLPVLNARGTLVLHGGEQSTFLYDLVSRRTVWRSPVHCYRMSFGPDFAVLQHPRWWRGDDWKFVIVDLETGALDHRFTQLAPLSEVLAFEESQYVIVDGWICHARSGALQWRLPSPDQSGNRFRFDEQDAVLCRDVADEKDRPQTIRWRASDGMLLEARPTGVSELAHRQSTPGGRYLVAGLVSGPRRSEHVSYLEKLLRRWLFVSARNDGNLECSFQVLDTKLGMTRGEISSQVFPQIAHDGSGCTVVRKKQIDWYRFPPRLNWAWLVGWSVGPPLALWRLLRVWRRWRLRWQAAAESRRQKKMQRLLAATNPAARARVAAARRWRLAAMIWGLGVLVAWNELVPLKPNRMVRFAEPTRIEGFHSAGELILAPRGSQAVAAAARKGLVTGPTTLEEHELPAADLLLRIAPSNTRWLNRLVAHLPPALAPQAMNATTLTVVKASSGLRAGFVRIGSRKLLLDPLGEGFVVHDDRGYEFYSATPARQWGWLAGWVLAPPAVVWGLRRLRSRAAGSNPAGAPG